MNEEEKAKEQGQKMEQLIAKAWADEAFKQRLIADPAAVLKEAGLEMPEGIEIRVVEDTEKVAHLVLPRKPSAEELSEEELSNAAGGHCGGGHCGCGHGGCGGHHRCGCGGHRCGCGCGCGCVFIRPCC